MTKTELLDLLAVRSAESSAEWAAAIVYEQQNGVLHSLTTNADQSSIGFRLAIQAVQLDNPDLPGALYALGGASFLDVQRGGGAASQAALAALAAYDAETLEGHDTVSSGGAVAVAGSSAPTEAVDTGQGDGTVV